MNIVIIGKVKDLPRFAWEIKSTYELTLLLNAICDPDFTFFQVEDKEQKQIEEIKRKHFKLFSASLYGALCR